MNNIFYSTGKKKTSVARVWMFFNEKCNNKIIINGVLIDKYFSRKYLSSLAIKPINIIENLDKFNIIVKVKGGGLSSQANAVKHGISRAILKKDPLLYKSKLRECGFITRDARKVERKKFGMSGARKKYQHSKR